MNPVTFVLKTSVINETQSGWFALKNRFTPYTTQNDEDVG
jgi:hypothetical protein